MLSWIAPKVQAEANHAPVWDIGTIDDILSYMAQNYDKTNKKWIFQENGIETWEGDTAYANAFNKSMYMIQEIRKNATETSVEDIIEHWSEWGFWAIRAAKIFENPEFQNAFVDFAYQLGWGIEDAHNFYTFCKNIAANIKSYADNLDETAWKTTITTQIKFYHKVSFKVTVVDLAFTVGRFIEYIIRDGIAYMQIQSVDLGNEDEFPVIEKLRDYELKVQACHMFFDLLKPIFELIVKKLATVIVLPITGAVCSTLGATAGAALGTVVPPLAAPAAYIGKVIGGLAGWFLGNYIGDKIGEAIGPSLVTAFEEVLADVGIIQQESLKKFEKYWVRYHVNVEVVDIWTDGQDNYVPPSTFGGFPHFDNIFVKIKNTGDVTADFIVSPISTHWTVLEPSLFSLIGMIDELLDILGGALTINSKMVTLQPGQETTLAFKVSPYGLPLVLGWPPLTLYGPEEIGFTVWYKSERFAVLAGPIRTGQIYINSAREMLWTTPGPKFQIEVACQKEEFEYLKMPVYKVNETVSTLITVTNTGTEGANFYLGVSFRSGGEASKEYYPDSILPKDTAFLDTGSSSTFEVKWTIPSDVEPGFYEIAVNCWKFGPGNVKDYKSCYDDNLLWETLLFIEKLKIIVPTTSSPVIAGDPSDPIPIYVLVKGIPPLPDYPAFHIEVGTEVASSELIDKDLVRFGVYVLKVYPPTQNFEGRYDLKIFVSFNDVLQDTATESQSVEYTKAFAAEPIGKGLNWLRIRQRSDGSWLENVGVTALVTLAFLNAGYDENDVTVSKAINYILSNVKADGSIYSSLQTYETSLAILALVATNNNTYRTIIENAKNWLIRSQWDENCIWGSVKKDNWYYGGFGYGAGRRPDLSNTQFALLALDAAGLPKDDPLWKKVQVFLHRCQNVNFSIKLNIEGSNYTVQPYNYYGGYDGGFIYHPRNSLAGDQKSYGSMTGAGIWGLLLSEVPKTDLRVIAAMNWVRKHYTWDGNPGMPISTNFQYYYYLTMSKALTMYGEKIIDGHDWYKEMYDKIVSLQKPDGYWINSDSRGWENQPELVTAYSILSLQTMAPQVVNSPTYCTFILRSNCFLRVTDPEGNVVGYNYSTGLGENQIQTAIYSGPFAEPQYILLINPRKGTYRLELIGVSEGSYELTIQGKYSNVTYQITYQGWIKRGELHTTDVIVTAIKRRIDIYAHPPKFDKVLDDIAPKTNIIIGKPNYIDHLNNLYVIPSTTIMLVPEDPSGILLTAYRIYNSTFDTGWLNYITQFTLGFLSDGNYTIAYYSIDNLGNVENPHQINVTLFSWNYIFEDVNGRKTVLKINLVHKFIQFITPDRDYDIRKSTYMQQCGRGIMVRHYDEELRLITIAIDAKLDFCVAIAWDIETGRRYLLMDKVGNEGNRKTTYLPPFLLNISLI